MDDEQRAAIVQRLTAVFGEARDVTPAPGQPLHVLLPEIALPEPWTPSPTRALTIWGAWPQGRPDFYIDAGVTGEAGSPPRNPNPVYLLGETWNGFSFAFGWAGDDPVRAVRTWLTRFEVERT
jgi:hypothetical protein